MKIMDIMFAPYRRMAGFSRVSRVTIRVSVKLGFTGAILYISMTWLNIHAGIHARKLGLNSF